MAERVAVAILIAAISVASCVLAYARLLEVCQCLPLIG